jgi:starch synthase
MAHLWERLWRADAQSPRILFATSEVAPLIKTGGLADVSAALPAALSTLGCETRVLVPAYGAVWRHVASSRCIASARIGVHRVEVHEAAHPSGVTVWLLVCPHLYDRPGSPYHDEHGVDWTDNAERFATLARAVVWLAQGRTGNFTPNVVHLNDWPTGLAAALLAREATRPRVVFSVHNLEYQGLFDRATFDALALAADLWSMDGLEFYGRMSFMKGGLVFADAITAVSPTYAREIQTAEFGFGLDGLLRHRAADLHGILNGIDTEVWNPASDRLIPARFDVDDLNGKAVCREALRARLGLAPADAPIAAVVSRFAGQKGIDLILGAVDRLAALPLQFAVLGSGAPDLEAGFVAASARHPGRVAYARGFDEGLAHLIEAGADLFLMPSRFEPCGLSQMYSMRYGTVPVVRRTGGLADTVEQVADGHGTGFLFEDPTDDALCDAVSRAVATMRDSVRWRAIQRAGMTRDFSWTRSAAQYRDLYATLLAAA